MKSLLVLLRPASALALFALAASCAEFPSAIEPIDAPAPPKDGRIEVLNAPVEMQAADPQHS